MALKKEYKVIILLVVIITFPVWGFIFLFIRKCIKSSIQQQQMTSDTIAYFSEKYNINKDNLKIKHNQLYGDESFCTTGLSQCGESYIIVTYNNEDYMIKYNGKFFEDYKK